MFASLNKFCLLVAAGGLLIPQVMAENAPSPLLQTLEALECATDVKAAHSVLNRLFGISPPGQEWPDEWLGTRPDSPGLYAGTLDIALNTLSNTAERYPELREEIERVALQWNYCDVRQEDTFKNLFLQNRILTSSDAKDDAPLKWEGFREWGFLHPDPEKRFIPLLLDEIRLGPRAYHLFLHRAYRQRCFPHPETGLLASEEDAPAASADRLRAVTEVATDAATAITYPFQWRPACHVVQRKPEAAPEPEPQLVKKDTPRPVKVIAQQKPEPEAVTATRIPASLSVPIEENQLVVQTPAPQPVVEWVAETPETKVVAPKPASTETPLTVGAKGDEGKAIHQEISLTEMAKLPNPPEGRSVLPTIALTPPANAAPIYYEDERLDTMPGEQAHSTTGIIGESDEAQKKTKKQKLRLSGSFSDTVSLQDGTNSLSASISWSPKKNWFVSGNVSTNNGEPGYSWSAGYSDWKPGTCSAQINNWGPLKRGEGLALDKAVANIGCKAKSETLEKHKLAASGNLSIPLGDNKPSVSGTMQWSPQKNWYVRTTASMPLEGGTPGWSYGFGYADYRPGKWRIEYSNYGKNDFPGDNLGDGAVTISRGWQY